MLPFQDPKLSPKERAHDLCARLTCREKVGQLNQRLYGFRSVRREGEQLTLDEAFQKEVLHFGGLGTLYGLYRADPWSGRTRENGLYGENAVRAYNLAQRFVVEHSRFGIPMLVSSECPHGHQALDGYLLPVNLAAGATFQPELLYEAGKVCGRQLRELGVDLALVSMLDILRDPRWGRSEECYGEDPFHAAQFARAIVRGIQSQGVAVVAKHFCAQGETTGGLNASAARIGPRELREIHLPAARAACRAGVKGIMAAYNEIDGVPCHANEDLLQKILRGEFGFDGIVMADGCAIDRLNDQTGSTVASGALALRSGIDISLWDEGFSRLEEALESGLIDEKVLNRAVERVLTLKLERGLFEHPYLPEERKPSVFSPKAFPQSLALSRESLVLLKNEGALPLQRRKTVALIGPAADDLYRQLGDYTPPVEPDAGCTLLQGLRELAGPEMRLWYDDGSDPKRAAALAAKADTVVLALGGSSSRFEQARFDKNGAALNGSMDCGEGVDSSALRLPDGQHSLFAKVRAAAKTLVTVLIVGRPYAVPEIAEGSDALMVAFYPGPWGGQALAEALLGRFSPSGRLPASFPQHPGQLPVYYNPKAGTVPWNYADLKDGPLFSFGDGMGYGHILYRDFELLPKQLPVGRLPADDTPVLELRFRAENPGPAEEHAVPLLFVTDLESDVARRVRELKAFAKKAVPAGESTAFSLTLTADDLAVWNRRMERELQRGRFRLRLEDGGRLLYETVWELK